MNTHPLILMSALLAALLAFNPSLSFAHGDKPHEQATPPAATEAHTPINNPFATVEDALGALKSEVSNIEALLKEGKLGSIHHATEDAGQSLAAIEATAKAEGEKKTRLHSALKQARARLGKLHDAADRNDKAPAEAEFTKLQGAVKLVESNLK